MGVFLLAVAAILAAWGIHDLLQSEAAHPSADEIGAILLGIGVFTALVGGLMYWTAGRDASR